MNKYSTPVLLLTWVSLASSAFCAKPNVLVILVDDLGHADMSYRADSPADVRTPNIDRLAQSGSGFETAYATAPICSPARAGLISGQYQQRWGNYWYAEGGLPDFIPTLPEVFKSEGYRTAKIGKTHMNGGQKEHPLDHGFDEFLGFLHHTWDYTRLSKADADAYNAKKPGSAKLATIGPLVRGRADIAEYESGFTTDIFTDEAIAFMESGQSEQPFFLLLSYNAVHHPTYITSEKYADLVGLEQPQWDREAESWEFPYWDPKKESWWQWHAKWGHMGEIDKQGRLRYLSQLTALDINLGRILDYLDCRQIREETIIVFLSDNGGSPNTYAVNFPLSGYKFMFAEGGLRIPLIFSWPGQIVSGEQLPQIVSAIDVFPSLMQLCGIEFNGNIDGKSLAQQLRSGSMAKTPVHDYLFWSDGRAFDPGSPDSGFWVVRHENWKLVNSPGWKHTQVRIEDGFSVYDGEYTFPEGILLFDLEEDPGETKNLAREYPEIVTGLTREFQKWGETLIPPVKGEDKNSITKEMLK